MSENHNYDAIIEALESQKPVTATVIESTDRGFYVDLFGIKSFLPGSETKDRENVKVDDSIEVTVLKINRSKTNIVVSNRVCVERKEKVLAQKAISEMHVGDTLQGVVKAVVRCGAFISLGQHVDGFVAIQEISWRVVFDINTVVKVGDVVDVRIVDIEERQDGTKRVELSIRQCISNPWATIRAEDYIDHVLECTVTHVTDYGIFVNIGEVEGLIHISEMSWNEDFRNKIKPSEIFSKGDNVTAKVVSCDTENRRMALSIKALLPNPWENITDEMIGKDVEVTIYSAINFGLLAEVQPGVGGLIHTSELSWAEIGNVRDVANIGDKLIVRIMGIDRNKRRMTLSRKAIVQDPWKEMDPMQYVGRSFDGKVSRVKNGVVFVMITTDMVGRLCDGEIEPDSVKVGDGLKVTPDNIDVTNKVMYLKVVH